MKLVNVRVIKDELERLIRNYRFYSSTEAKYRYEAYKELSEWLDGIEVEEPSKDLEEAAWNHPSAIHTVSPQWSSEVINAFKAGAAWQKQHLIEKACEWLEEHLLDFWSQVTTNTDYFIEDFKKAMNN